MSQLIDFENLKDTNAKRVVNSDLKGTEQKNNHGLPLIFDNEIKLTLPIIAHQQSKLTFISKEAAGEVCLKMYSISQAAKQMQLSRDTIKGLISAGKLGYIEIGRSKKIPHGEILRFQRECIIRNDDRNLRTSKEENKIGKGKRVQKKGSIGGCEILEELLKKEDKWQ